MKKGTHGTCKSYAQTISTYGFKASNGRLGKGIYFWAYFDIETEFYAEDLATSWWLYSKGMGRYKDAEDNSRAVIFVEINPTENCYLDLEDTDIKSKFISFSNKVYKKHNQKHLSKQNALEATYDLFVNLIKKQLDIEFEVIHVRVAPPSNEYYRPSLPIEITGAPSCFVVNNNNCIAIRKID